LLKRGKVSSNQARRSASVSMSWGTNRQETPCAEGSRGTDVETSILQSLSVLVDQTLEDSARRRSISSVRHTISQTRKRIVRLRRHPILVPILHRQVRRSSNTAPEQRSTQSTPISHSLQHNRATTSGLATDSYGARISSKRCNVLLHPFESEGLIEDTGVDGTEAVDFVRRKEAEGTEAVLDSYTDERAVVGVDNGLHVLLTIAKSIATAVNPDEYWKIGCVLRSIDIEEQAVLSGKCSFTSWSYRTLRALRCECIGLDDLTAVLGRNLWRLEA
jgi:hypothetical protein